MESHVNNANDKPTYVERLKTMGHWLKTNGQAFLTETGYKRRLFTELVETRLKVDPFASFTTIAQTHQRSIYSDFEFNQMKNGIARTSTSYYAIARDDDGQHHIYWSRAQKNLKTVADPETDKKKFIDNEYRYHLATLSCDVSKAELREVISNHHRNLRQFDSNHMSLQGGDMTSTISTHASFNQDDHSRLQTYGFTNMDFALSVHENPDESGKKWSFAISRPIKNRKGQKHYVEIDNIPAHEKISKAILSNGTEIEGYDTRGEAFANMFVAADHRTQMTWRGQNPISVHKNHLGNALTAGWNSVMGEVISPENKVEFTFDVLSKVAFAMFAKTAFTLTLAKAAVIGAASGWGNRKLLGGAKAVTDNVRWLFKKANSVDPQRAKMIVPTRENMRRKLNTKPNIENEETLDVLDGKQIDITRDDQIQADNDEPFWKETWLCAYDGKAFTRLISNIDDSTSTEFSCNGLVRLVRKDKDTGHFVTYVKYVEALDINAHISIPKEIKDMLIANKLTRLDYDKGDDYISCNPADFSALETEIYPALFSQETIASETTIEAAQAHIQSVFGEVTEKEQDDPSSIPLQHGPLRSLVIDHHQERTLKSIFGKENPDIPSASSELVEFFENIQFPVVNMGITQPA